MNKNTFTKGKGVKTYRMKPVFKDWRGEIFDILEETVQHVGMVTFSRAGVSRGNHYHLKSVQYSYVLTGKIKLITSDIDGSNMRQTILGPGSFSSIPPRVIHTYTSLMPSSMLDLTTQSRKKNGYETDTHRVDR